MLLVSKNCSENAISRLPRRQIATQKQHLSATISYNAVTVSCFREPIPVALIYVPHFFSARNPKIEIIMTKSVLIIAFHFPPAAGSSGVHRAHAMAEYLPTFGWRPVVLTASIKAHSSTNNQELNHLHPSVVVRRSHAFDAARHLSLAGKYPDFFAWPDRWSTWWPSAVVTGLNLIRRYRPKLIWSTYPIATAHLIGSTLQRLTGLPWVADFRDSMTDEYFPSDKARRYIFNRIERRAVHGAAVSVFTAPGTQDLYISRYPNVSTQKFQIILNGFDENSFQIAEDQIQKPRDRDKFLLLHSGVIYPKERDPRALFRALVQLRHTGLLTSENFELRLRATGHDQWLATILEELRLGDIVKLAPPLPYVSALAEMMSADGLLLLQSASCNHQIPAKLYEYLRAKRPILALTDFLGDTAKLLQEASAGTIVPLDSVNSIVERLGIFIEDANESRFFGEERDITRYSRMNQVANYAKLFDDTT